MPAGQVGPWCSEDSDNEFDALRAQEIAGPPEVDDRWFCDRGEVRDDLDNNVLESYSTYWLHECIIRGGNSRGSDDPAATSSSPRSSSSGWAAFVGTGIWF